MPASNLDFSVITHVIHFSLIPNADGSLNTDGNTIKPAYTADLVTRAHAAGRKALICVGGAGTSFQNAVSGSYLAGFLTHLTNFIETHITDRAGADTWTDAWFALRELLQNALDEGGGWDVVEEYVHLASGEVDGSISFEKALVKSIVRLVYPRKVAVKAI